MIHLILKLFIYNKPRSEQELRTRCGTVGGTVGIVLNALLALFKALAGILFGSIALVADAANNLTDAASSIITLIGFKLAAKKPDSDHPYGHGRIEYISGLLMSFLILLLGLSLAKSSIECIITPKDITFSWLSIAVMTGAIVAKFWLSLFNRKLQKITGSATFGAVAVDSRNDCITTLAVLASTIIYTLTKVNIDGITGLVVSIFILVSGVGLIKETLDPLLGRPPAPELVKAIEQKALGYEGIIGIHDLVVHDYGPGRVFVSLHAEVAADGDILESHDLIDNIERDFKNEMHLETVIHIDPIVTDDPMVNAMKQAVLETLHQMDPRLSMHDFRAVPGNTHTNLIFDVVLPADFSQSKKAFKADLDNRLATIYPDVFTVITFDRDFTATK